MADLNRIADLLMPGLRSQQLRLEEVSAYLDQILATLRLNADKNEWQPIETAPKDGTRILAFGKHGFESEDGIATVIWDSYYKGFVCDPNEATENDCQVSDATDWMPLPKPPAQRNKDIWPLADDK